jgi:hypothetical protein
VTIVAGILTLLTGLAYSGLGMIAVYEIGRNHRTRGVSYLGGAFALMAATCGPHHLVHAEHHLLWQQPASIPMVVALAVGLVPGATFVGFRIEAMLGGAGDRFIPGTPLVVAALPMAVAAVAGVTVFEAIEKHAQLSTVGLAANLMLFANYMVVGILVLRTQRARRPALGGWSLSGLALGGVFVTCGLSHLVAALTTTTDWHTLLFDIPGVPFSLYFLWVVRSLNRHALRDWNRRPLVGRAARQSRRSPWAPA